MFQARSVSLTLSQHLSPSRDQPQIDTVSTTATEMRKLPVTSDSLNCQKVNSSNHLHL